MWRAWRECLAALLSILAGAWGQGLRWTGGNTIDCIVNTGGTCASQSCYRWRGPTKCKTGRCFCEEGTCAGGNGTCTDTPYVLNDTQYRIKNARWPEYYIDVDAFGSVDIESTAVDEPDNRFTIRRPHQELGGKILILLVSVRWPNAVLRVYKGGSSALRFQTALQHVDGGLAGLVPDPSIHDLALTLSIAPDGAVNPVDGEPLIMMSSYKWPNEYLYVTTYRASVDVHRDDPGAGGYWVFEPALPPDIMSQLPRYSGQKCKVSCGDVAVAGAPAGEGIWLAIFVSTVAMIIAPLARL